MARRTVLVTASILLSALGTALIWLYVQGAEARERQRLNLVQVLFLTRNVQAGESPVGAVTTQQLPASAAGGAVTSVSQLGTQKLTVDAVAGQVLLRSMLGTSVNERRRFPVGGAAAVTISDPNRVPADLQPGDSVDIFALSKDGATRVLSDITVRTVGSAHARTTGPSSANGTAADGAAANGTAANGTAANGAVSPSIVGLDIKDAQTATTLYDLVARGNQIALYLHNPPPR